MTRCSLCRCHFRWVHADTEGTFKFVVDGEWQTDAAYPETTDAAGNVNNCLAEGGEDSPCGTMLGCGKTGY
jgi:hypothetical protein